VVTGEQPGRALAWPPLLCPVLRLSQEPPALVARAPALREPAMPPVRRRLVLSVGQLARVWAGPLPLCPVRPLLGEPPALVARALAMPAPEAPPLPPAFVVTVVRFARGRVWPALLPFRPPLVKSAVPVVLIAALPLPVVLAFRPGFG